MTRFDPAQMKHELRNALARAQATMTRLNMPESKKALDQLIDRVNEEIEDG